MAMFLRTLEGAWADVPEAAVEWATLDGDQRETYIVEWALNADELTRLERYANVGALTPAQVTRYGALRALIERNRPILDRLIH